MASFVPEPDAGGTEPCKERIKKLQTGGRGGMASFVPEPDARSRAGA